MGDNRRQQDTTGDWRQQKVMEDIGKQKGAAGKEVTRRQEAMGGKVSCSNQLPKELATSPPARATSLTTLMAKLGWQRATTLPMSWSCIP